MNYKSYLLEKILIFLFLSILLCYQTHGAAVAKTKISETKKNNQDELTELERKSEEEEEEEEIEKALERPGLFEGDIKLSDDKNRQKRDATSFSSRLWTGKTLYYKFDAQLSSLARQAVLAAMNHISSQTCIRFVERTTEASYVLVIAGSGCYSYIGRIGTKQDLSIGRGCEYLGVAAHELYHALGFYHEQSRLDRDNYITINFQNIQSGRESNFRKHSSGAASDIGAPYDLESLMHYGRRAFSNGGGDTITPKNPSAKIGQRRALSPIDIWQLKKLYQCSGTPATPPPAPGSTVPTNPPSSDECVVYKEINDASRSVERIGGLISSDSGFINTQWYRFVGPAGTIMPTLCQLPRRCGADYPGWMMGSHPSVADGPVNRRVCFASDLDCCRYQQMVSVRNCGNFYVYRLEKPSTVANVRYCVTKVLGKNFDCTFESGMCGLTNIGGDNFDWDRNRGPTASRSTGPDSDHTTKSSSGFYMYIETSSPRIPGDKARLVSPVLCGSSSVTFKGCIKFAYHMFGSAIGSLNVNVNGIRQWSISGSQEGAWRTTVVPFTAKGCYQVTFEGIRGSSFTGDIAIDDVSIESESNACTQSPSPKVFSVNCTFENGMCSMQNTIADKFDWELLRGRTPSPNTGPTKDHTTSTGYYIYTEASSPRQPDDVALLQSPLLTRKDSKGCIQFWYHMYGAQMGTLTVKVDGNILWQKSDGQEDLWKRAAVSFTPKNTTYRVTFESKIGGGFQSDIAIDDLVIQTGSLTCQ